MATRRKKNRPKVLYEVLTLDSSGRPVLTQVTQRAHNLVSEVENRLMKEYEEKSQLCWQQRINEIERQERLRESLEAKQKEEKKKEEKLREQLAIKESQAKKAKEKIESNSKQEPLKTTEPPPSKKEVDPNHPSDSGDSPSSKSPSTHGSPSGSSSSGLVSPGQYSPRLPTQSSSRSPTPSPVKFPASSARSSPSPQDSSSARSLSTSFEVLPKSAPRIPVDLSEPIDFFDNCGGEFLLYMSIEEVFKVILTEQTEIYAITVSMHHHICFLRPSTFCNSLHLYCFYIRIIYTTPSIRPT